jgi:hypothetical protein
MGSAARGLILRLSKRPSEILLRIFFTIEGSACATALNEKPASVVDIGIVASAQRDLEEVLSNMVQASRLGQLNHFGLESLASV